MIKAVCIHLTPNLFSPQASTRLISLNILRTRSFASSCCLLSTRVAKDLDSRRCSCISFSFSFALFPHSMNLLCTCTSTHFRLISCSQINKAIIMLIVVCVISKTSPVFCRRRRRRNHRRRRACRPCARGCRHVHFNLALDNDVVHALSTIHIPRPRSTSQELE